MFYEGSKFLSENARKSMDMVNQLCNTFFNGFQKISQLQLDVSKKNLESLLNVTSDIGVVNIFEDVCNKFNKYTNDTMGQDMENLKTSYDVLNNTQEQCSHIFEACLNDTKQSLFESFKYLSCYTNYQASNNLKDTWQRFLAATNQALKNMNEFALKSSHFAQEKFDNMANSFGTSAKPGKESHNK